MLKIYENNKIVTVFYKVFNLIVIDIEQVFL